MKSKSLACLISAFSLGLFVLSSSAVLAADYDCASVTTFNTELKTLKTDVRLKAKAFANTKKKYKTRATDQDITDAKQAVTDANTFHKATRNLIKTTKERLQFPTKGDKIYANLEKKTDKNIASLKKIYEDIKVGQAAINKVDPKKLREHVGYIFDKIHTKITSVYSIMPGSMGGGTILNTRGLDIWVKAARNKLHRAPSVDSLTAKQLVDYRFLTTPALKKSQRELKIIQTEQAYLQKLKDENKLDEQGQGSLGVTSGDAWKQYEDINPPKIKRLSKVVRENIQAAMTNATAQVDDVGVERDVLAKKEKQLYGEHQKLVVSLHAMKAEKAALIKAITKDGAASRKRAKAVKKELKTKLAEAKTKLIKEKSTVVTAKAKLSKLKAGQAMWDMTEDGDSDAKDALDIKQQEKIVFEVRLSQADSQIVGQVQDLARAAVADFKTKAGKYKKAAQKLRRLLKQRKNKLIKNAKILKKRNKYTANVKKAYLRNWRNYRKVVNDRLTLIRQRVRALKQKAARGLRSAAAILRPYNCLSFPKAKAYRRKLLDAANKYSRLPVANTSSVLGFRMYLPAVSVTNVSGNWNSRYGCFAFAQSKDRVTGRIYYKNGNKGSLAGRAANSVLVFSWRHRTQRGTGRLTLSSNGKSMSGNFRRSGGASARLYLSKRYGACPVYKVKPKPTYCPVCREKCYYNCTVKYRGMPKSCRNACNLCKPCGRS